MNSVSAPSQSKRPPEKGVFPLDHDGECKPKMKEEELENLGFHEKGMQKTRAPSYEGRKEEEGFVAGLGVKKARYKD
ncbi:hypothetical protein ATCC90586_000746 [Pythium insidiosum]|nr:hypothetical protein ATCC90586_000746 [Pythium insidiosum]